MMTSLFTAATGMKGQQSQIDTIANNLANVNTNGFKKTRNNFQDLLYSHEIIPGSNTSSNTISPTGLHKGHGVKLAGTQKVFSQGNLTHTGHNLDISIDGNVFFRFYVQTAPSPILGTAPGSAMPTGGSSPQMATRWNRKSSSRRKPPSSSSARMAKCRC
jgi:flagellar hook protein FlgE